MIGFCCQLYSFIILLSGVCFAFPMDRCVQMSTDPDGSMHMVSGFVSVLLYSPGMGSPSHGPSSDVGWKNSRRFFTARPIGAIFTTLALIPTGSSFFSSSLVSLSYWFSASIDSMTETFHLTFSMPAFNKAIAAFFGHSSGIYRR